MTEGKCVLFGPSCTGPLSTQAPEAKTGLFGTAGEDPPEGPRGAVWKKPLKLVSDRREAGERCGRSVGPQLMSGVPDSQAPGGLKLIHAPTF